MEKRLRVFPPAQRLAVVEKFKKKIQEEAKEKYNATVGRPSKNNCSPNGEQLNNKLHTDKELAKLAGVVLEPMLCNG